MLEAGERPSSLPSGRALAAAGVGRGGVFAGIVELPALKLVTGAGGGVVRGAKRGGTVLWGHEFM